MKIRDYINFCLNKLYPSVSGEIEGPLNLNSDDQCILNYQDKIICLNLLENIDQYIFFSCLFPLVEQGKDREEQLLSICHLNHLFSSNLSSILTVSPDNNHICISKSCTYSSYKYDDFDTNISSFIHDLDKYTDSFNINL